MTKLKPGVGEDNGSGRWVAAATTLLAATVDLLERILSDLDRHCAGGISDDVLLVIAEQRAGSRPDSVA